MRTAVVGHLEWVDFVRVGRLPQAGDIVQAEEWWEEPAGGGPGAAVQLRKLAGECLFFTALGDDALGHRAYEGLVRRGLRVEAVFRRESTRRAITHVDSEGERGITVLGERLAPHARDPLAWHELAEVDGVYFTAGDVAALRCARLARVLVATARILPVLAAAGVELDALVGSETDPDEAYAPGDIDPPPRLVVRTRGGEGGSFAARDGRSGRYPATAPPGPLVDTYGAGDSFAAGLAYALASGKEPEAAVAFAARCGAAVLTGRGPYEGQLERAD